MARVLVADVDEDVRQNLRSLLTGEGYIVVEAENGEQILARIAEERPDILLIDVVLERLSGFEVIAAIRDNPDLAGLPVIVITARGHPDDRARAIDLGVADYIVKPWMPGEIELRVRWALESAATGPAAARASLRRSGWQPPTRPETRAGGSARATTERPQAAGRVAPGARREPMSPPAPGGAPTAVEPTLTAGAEGRPSGREDLSDPAAEITAPPVPSASPAGTVLIAEDEEYARLPLVDAMLAAGYRTLEETDGAAVYDRIKEEAPDCVLLDLTLPRRDGFQILRQLKGDSKTRTVPVIIVTGSSNAQSMETCLTLGARDYVMKPWHKGDLQHRVQRAIESARALARQAERAMQRAKARTHRGSVSRRAARP